MSLSDLAAVGSFVSGLAVLASLAFLYLQMRQMTEQVRQTEKNQQAQIRQARTTRIVDIVLRGLEPSVASAMANTNVDDPSPELLFQHTMWFRATFFDAEDSFYQHQSGLLSQSAFNTLAITLRALVGDVAIRAQWRRQRVFFDPEFVAWFDKLVAQTPIAEVVDPIRAWRDLLAAERAHAPYA
jgi:hypothetical protein